MPEKPRRASALKYEGTGAPKLVASGQGLIADRIVAAAREAGVAARPDGALAPAPGGPAAAADPGALGVRVPVALHDPVAHRVARVDLPAEQLGEVALQLLPVLPHHLEVDHRLPHALSSHR